MVTYEEAAPESRRQRGLLRGFALVAALAVFSAWVVPTSHASVTADSRADASFDKSAPAPIQLAGKKDGGSSRPPVRGSSAELYGGSSADRYGGSSADRRGVAGRRDIRNRGVHQFTQNKKRDGDRSRKKSDELDDQEQTGPKDMFQFEPGDPSQSRDRTARD